MEAVGNENDARSHGDSIPGPGFDGTVVGVRVVDNVGPACCRVGFELGHVQCEVGHVVPMCCVQQGGDAGCGESYESCDGEEYQLHGGGGEWRSLKPSTKGESKEIGVLSRSGV